MKYGFLVYVETHTTSIDLGKPTQLFLHCLVLRECIRRDRSERASTRVHVHARHCL